MINDFSFYGKITPLPTVFLSNPSASAKTIE
jgi:hypothetical protein